MKIGVTGTPGSGKTTFSKILSQRLRYNLVNVEDIIIEEKLYIDYDEKRMSFIIDMDKAYEWFTRNSKENTIYEGLSIAYIADENWLDKIIILRCDPYTLEERLKKKGFPYEKIKENVASEILDVVASEVYSRFDRNKTIQIDNSKNIDASIEKAINFIKGERVEDDFVDWLSLVAERNDVKRFLD